MGHMEKKNEHIKTYDSASQDKKRRHKKISKASTISDTNCKLRQPTILDVLRKSGNLTSQGVLTEDALSTVSNSSKFGYVDETSCGSNEPVIVEVSALAKVLETQRFKFRPLLFPCLSILTFSKVCLLCCNCSVFVCITFVLFIFLKHLLWVHSCYVFPYAEPRFLLLWSCSWGTMIIALLITDESF